MPRCHILFRNQCRDSVIRVSQMRSLATFQRKMKVAAAGKHLTAKQMEYEEVSSILSRYQHRAGVSQSNIGTPADKMKALLLRLGHDVDGDKAPKVIHVAGTKGKGTTCQYCSRMLVEHQKNTGIPKNIGLLTSPHQIDVRERISINNKMISKELFSKYVRDLDGIAASGRLDLDTLKYPAFMTLLGLHTFYCEKVDVIVLETGVGGETDSTNVFPHPVATGITTIGLDHTDVLGRTMEQIAWHKAGIFKIGSPAASVPQADAILQVLRDRAEQIGVTGELQLVDEREVIKYGVKVDPDMSFQRKNASLAIWLVEKYLQSTESSYQMSGVIARSLQDIVLLGKSQIVNDGGNTWFVCSGHNEISLKENISWYKRSARPLYHNAPRVLIFNAPREQHALLSVIYNGLCIDESLQGVIFCTDQLTGSREEKPDMDDRRGLKEETSLLRRQLNNERIWRELGGSGATSVVCSTEEAFSLVKEKYKGAEVFVTGSAYLSGNVLSILQLVGQVST